MIKKILLGLLVLLLLAQIYRPAKNLSGETTNSLSTKYAMPDNVKKILETSCYDCHSNKTVYPWYSNFQPVASFLANHVNEGKRKFNFDTFTSRKIAIQNHKLEELIEMVEENEMPLSSYTLIHRDAKLSESQKTELISWAKGLMEQIKNTYPADSLVLKRK